MMTEEINIEGGNSYHSQRGSQGKALYTSSNRSRGRENWRGGGRFNNNARGRGSFNATRGGRTIQQSQQTQPNQQGNFTCHYCGKVGHYARDCFSNPNRRGDFRGRQRGRGQDHMHHNNNIVQEEAQTQKENVLMAMHTETHKRKVNNKTWYVGSGCSNHMSHNMNMFVNLHKPDSRVIVATGDSTEHEVVYIGDCPLNEHVTLRDVLFVPTITRNLISVGQMEDNGVKVDFDNNQWQAYQKKDGNFVIKGQKVNRLYVTVSVHVKGQMATGHFFVYVL
ncbi:hypothetical protein KP509_07G023600 [Ceratopteris richardii]|uniref:CCHC-type domain-containing protein n=1 Tax=Ceratopteris richardii TaxID=49495 RepID=A0A8T2UAP2_CERRI|nr:hypothetical protein KP509_07G023600 [Ceratopteris richardii]